MTLYIVREIAEWIEKTNPGLERRFRRRALMKRFGRCVASEDRPRLDPDRVIAMHREADRLSARGRADRIAEQRAKRDERIRKIKGWPQPLIGPEPVGKAVA